MPRDRSPPKSPHWNVTRGNCRFCGDTIVDRDGVVETRKHWHEGCAKTWRRLNNQGTARSLVQCRDKGACAHCGRTNVSVWLRSNDGWKQGRRWRWRLSHYRSLHDYCEIEPLDGPYTPVQCWTGWEADHIHPLHLVDRTIPWPDVLWYWSLENLQTLCVACHLAKSAREKGRGAPTRAA